MNAAIRGEEGAGEEIFRRAIPGGEPHPRNTSRSAGMGKVFADVTPLITKH
ncbi:hypothetical protein [Streptomyces sp. NPDC049040]|uniref:hypothetical protein n=1 Tax=Streptomyces sp. NPDC049040 TaxID=3365593 RepID=UPI00371ABEBC